MTGRTWQVMGLVLGLAIGGQLTAVAQGQSNKVLSAAGLALCVDFESRDVPLTLKVDATAAVPATGVIWEGTAAPFTAKIPLSAMPQSAQAIGAHTITVTAPDQTVLLADGSTVTIPGGSVSTAYEVISPNGPNPTNPRWVRIVGK